MLKHHVLSKLITAASCCLLIACGSEGGAESPSSAPKAEKPNVIVIYTDDMNFKDAAVFGGQEVMTPTIDKLASEGARLDRYYAMSPVCSPSRYNVLTGRYASYSTTLRERYKATEPAFLRWNTHIENEETTIAEMLKGSGYVTGFVGKYHNFDNEPFQMHNALDDNPRDPEVAGRIKQNYDSIRAIIQKTTGFDYMESLYFNNLHAMALPKELQEHNQEWITDSALEFIDQNKDKPFYLYFATTTPHGPPPVQSMKSDPRITPSGFLKTEETPQVQASRESAFLRVKQAGLPESAAVMLWIDDAIKALLDRLEQHGVLDNTLIIFASDHSGKNGGRGKMTNYEGGVNTPALVWWPKKIKPQVVDSLVSAVDIVPTVLDAAGVSTEDKPLDGSSMLPLLSGEVDQLREDAYLEITYTRGVVTDRWKYIAIRFPSEIHDDAIANPGKYNQEGLTMTTDALAGALRVRYNAHELHPGYFDLDQLYDLKNDPDELNNLANDPNYAEVLADMKARLKKHVAPLPHDFGEFK